MRQHVAITLYLLIQNQHKIYRHEGLDKTYNATQLNTYTSNVDEELRLFEGLKSKEETLNLFGSVPESSQNTTWNQRAPTRKLTTR